MHERLKASEVGQIECQTCEKKIYVVKKNLGKIFLKFFSWILILIYILNYFYHFQPLSYYKKCAYLKEVIRRDSDQCGNIVPEINDSGPMCITDLFQNKYLVYLNPKQNSFQKIFNFSPLSYVTFKCERYSIF